MGQGARGVGDLVDVEEDGARDMLLVVFGPRAAVLHREVIAGVDDPEVGVGQMLGEPGGADQALGMGIARHHGFLKARLTRRFCLPLLSIFTTCTGPVSPWRAMWEPPQGCRSAP